MFQSVSNAEVRATTAPLLYTEYPLSGQSSAARGVPRHDVLNGPGEDVPVVREPRGEGRAVVEGVRRLPLGLLQGSLERLDLPPVPAGAAGSRQQEIFPLQAQHNGRSHENASPNMGTSEKKKNESQGTATSLQ